MNKDSKIYIAGHNGLVGSAIRKNLEQKGYTNLLFRTSSELDLTDQSAVNAFFASEQPEYVFLAAALVGGIMANTTRRADFIYTNLMIHNNVIHASYINNVKKLLFLGSTCIYPKDAPQPMSEDCLLSSALEYTNEPYAIAKIAGIKMCESYNLQYATNFIAIMPTNLYGPNDNFDLESSHVLPAMIRKMYLATLLSDGDWSSIRKDLAKRPVGNITGESSEGAILEMLEKQGITNDRLILWGTGEPLREFLWSEDMADASVYMMEQVDFDALRPKTGEIRNTHINIGTGIEHSIKELAVLIKDIIGYKKELAFDASKPNGTPRKLTDVTKLHQLGWHHAVELKEGVQRLYDWYLNN